MLIEAVVHGRGPTSGAPVATREFFIMEIRGAAAITFREFLDRDDGRGRVRRLARVGDVPLAVLEHQEDGARLRRGRSAADSAPRPGPGCR